MHSSTDYSMFNDRCQENGTANESVDETSHIVRNIVISIGVLVMIIFIGKYLFVKATYTTIHPALCGLESQHACPNSTCYNGLVAIDDVCVKNIVHHSRRNSNVTELCGGKKCDFDSNHICKDGTCVKCGDFELFACVKNNNTWCNDHLMVENNLCVKCGDYGIVPCPKNNNTWCDTYLIAFNNSCVYDPNVIDPFTKISITMIIWILCGFCCVGCLALSGCR
jgi:hypothetical protein